MKKLLTILSLLVYFAVSTGFVISVHFCMNEMNGVELGHAELEQCNKCGMFIEDQDGCCKDEVKVVKLQIDQTIAKLMTADFSIPLVASFTTEFLLTPLVTEDEAARPVANGPPLDEQDTYLHNRVFRI